MMYCWFGSVSLGSIPVVLDKMIDIEMPSDTVWVIEEYTMLWKINSQ